MAKILFLMMLPFVCFSQTTPSEDIPVNNLLKEKENLDTKRKALYNLEEIKVRWKKAALENCPGVPCVVTPPAPSFTCGTTTVSDIDGNTYNIVLIGTQCWTKENLKVTRYNDGTPIPLDASGGPVGNGSTQTWTTLMSGAYTISANTGSNATIFGFLYNWNAAVGIISPGVSSTKNICPTGYHVPTDSDWNKLVKFIDSAADTTTTIAGTQSTSAGTKLKKKDALWFTNLGTDDFLFSALPGGQRNFWTGQFVGLNDDTYFWSATVNINNSISAWTRYVKANNGDVLRNNISKFMGVSVRCLKD